MYTRLKNIWRKIESLKDIREGRGIKDKMIILLQRLLCFVSFPINKISYELRKDYVFYHADFYLADFYCKNADGIFFCRKRTDDFDMVKSNFERAIANYFDIKSGIFVDLGSHIGKYAVRFSKKLGKNGKVIAVEPDKDNYNILLKNLQLNNCKNVIPLNVAVWSKDGRIGFYNHGIMKSNQSAVIVGFNPPVDEKPTFVEAKRLDTILNGLGIKKVDFIKMDIEGAETEAFKGMKETFKNNPNIKMVFESWELDDHLKNDKKILSKYGYDVLYIGKGLNDGSQTNYIITKKGMNGK